MDHASNFETVKEYNLLKEWVKEFEWRDKSLDNQNRVLEYFDQWLCFFLNVNKEKIDQVIS